MPSQEAAFGGVERDTQFGIVDADVIRDKTLPRNVKTVYTYLATFAGKQRSAFPSRKRMAEETGLSMSAVDEANKIGAACGLWTIVRRTDPDNPKRNLSSIYRLHDNGHGYVPGSGPGPRLKGKPRGKHAPKGGPQSEPGVAQNLGEGGPNSVQYQNHLSGPSTTRTSNASGADDSIEDAYQRVVTSQAQRPRASSQPPKIRIHVPRGFNSWEQGDAQQKLIACAVTAVEKAGRWLTPGTNDRLGAWVRGEFDYGLTARQVAKNLEKLLNEALDPEHRNHWLTTEDQPGDDPFASAP